MNLIAGHPTPFKLKKGRMLLLSYVSIGEWQTLSELLRQAADDAYIVTFLIRCSVQRADPRVSAKEVFRIIRKNKNRLLPLMDVICKISLAEVPTPKTASKTSTQSLEKNTKTMYRILSRLHGWTPRQITDMSPAQIYVYLTGGDTGTGIEKMSSSQYQELRRSRGITV